MYGLKCVGVLLINACVCEIKCVCVCVCVLGVNACVWVCFVYACVQYV